MDAMALRLARQTVPRIGSPKVRLQPTSLCPNQANPPSSSPQATPKDYANSLATSYGPGPPECTSRLPFNSNSNSNPSYGPTVSLRSQKRPQGDWDERVRIYSEALALGDWRPTYPNHQTPLWSSSVSSSNSSNGQDQARLKKGAFSYPVHVVFGLRDIALNPGIVLGGLEGFMLDSEEGMRKAQVDAGRGVEFQSVGRSSITRLPLCGHWVMLEDQGKVVLEELLGRLVEGFAVGAG